MQAHSCVPSRHGVHNGAAFWGSRLPTNLMKAPVPYGKRPTSRVLRLVSQAPPPETAGTTIIPEKSTSSDDTIQQFLQRDYKWGFVSDIESVQIPKGLSEETVRVISAKKKEPEWMLEFRLSAFRQWQKMTEPNWSDNKYPPIDYQVRLLSWLSEILFAACLRMWGMG